jgi:hypothetical protein
MRRRFAVASGAGLVLAALGAACATSGGDASSHGPVFDLSDGATVGVDGGNPSDDAPSSTNDGHAPVDSATPVDAPVTNESDGSDATTSSLEDAGTGNDASDASTTTGPDCGAKVAVLAGGASSLSGALAVGEGAFTVQSIGGSATLTPALVATGSGFEALVAMAGDAGGGYPLFGVGLAGATWSSPAALGATASALDAPGAAVVGSDVEAAYLNPQHLYFHAEWNGTSWNAGTDPVTPSGGVQSFGPVRPSVASTGSELVIAYEGNDQHLYAQSWTSSGGWQAAVQIGTGTLATNTPPALVVLTGGGTDDLLAVYDAPPDGATEQHIFYAVRTASSKAWSTPAQISATVFSPNPPVLAPLSNGRALLGWRGGNQQAYTAEYDPTPTPGWTAATGIGASTVAVPPSLAAGTCGKDAVAVVVSGGTVSTSTYASGAWASPAAITGITGAQVAAVATSP